jgi:hypothetical protein
MIDMRRNLNRERYLRKAMLYDELIRIEIQQRKDDERQTKEIIAQYASIILDPRNPYNRQHLAKFKEFM